MLEEVCSRAHYQSIIGVTGKVNSRNRNLWFFGFTRSGLKFRLKDVWSNSNHDLFHKYDHVFRKEITF